MPERQPDLDNGSVLGDERREIRATHDCKLKQSLRWKNDIYQGKAWEHRLHDTKKVEVEIESR